LAGLWAATRLFRLDFADDLPLHVPQGRSRTYRISAILMVEANLEAVVTQQREPEWMQAQGYSVNGFRPSFAAVGQSSSHQRLQEVVR
jgi:hypothetical protein